ncbi:MAG TPA: response regulator [Pyrinomonadaceae bacterium]|nr:response regulator [Pyrinomonadaceae bacterium]
MPRILLVDDEPNIRWTMAEFLKRANCEVCTAANFEEALAVFGENEIDVAVVDIVLPRKSGISVLEELHNLDPDLPIIMMTGEPNLSHLPDIVRAGAYDFLTKPVTKEVLLKAVTRAFEKKQLQDEKSRLEKEIAQHAGQLEVAIAERTAELVEARNFLKTVLDSSTEYAIIVTDPAGRILLFNRGAELMFQYEAERVTGRPAGELICHEEQSPSQNPFCVEITAAGQNDVQELEIKLKRADETRFVASLAMTIVQTAEGRWLGRLAIIKDLTVERQQEEELRQMQEQLARNEKIAALGRMAAQVAHEVRNPLSGLRLYALHLKSKVADKLIESEVSLIDKILRNIDHLADTTEQILNVARPLQLTFQPKRIEPIVDDCLQLVESQRRASQVEVKLDLETAETAVEVDEASLRSALVNLLLNSIQAMPTGGVLTVSSRKCDQHLLLAIADTGCGMSVEQAEKVFEPFYTTKSTGLGLGMPFAKRVIEQHRGTVRVTSSPGQGTEVEIKLPLTG